MTNATIIPIRRGLEAPDDSGLGDTPQFSRAAASIPTSRPAPDWLELCRKEFCRRYYAENGDLIDDCNQVYGD